MRVAVVGAGAAGLAAAWDLASSGSEVVVYEPGHLGGKLLTSEFMGRQVDEGADSLLARVPEGVAICEELGLAGELEAPAASEALVWSEGRLYRLPEGLVLGAPARLGPLARSGILSMAGLARASADLVLPARPHGNDESVWDLVTSRFGAEVARKLVEPLVGGIYAGSIQGLSAAIAAPQLLAAAKSSRSLTAGLRRATGAARTSGPVFLAPRSGMQAIADRLVERLSQGGAAFVRSEVSALRPDGRSVVVEPAGEHFDGVVVAVPAPVAAHLLQPLGVEASRLEALEALPWASVGIITLALPESALAVPHGASGVLVAEGTAGQMTMTACTFGSNKWPRWSVPGAAVLRVSVGRASDTRWLSLADEALVERVLDDLALVLRPGTAGRRPPDLSPLSWRVSRWPSALPQYPVEHLEQVASLRVSLRRQAPAVALAGASYGRVGVPACIASGRQAAAAVREALGSAQGAGNQPAA